MYDSVLLCTITYDQFVKKTHNCRKYIHNDILCQKRFLKYKQVLLIAVSNKVSGCLAFKYSLKFFIRAKCFMP